MKSNSLAIVPAAGASARMGEPKLLLPWGGSTILAATVAAWKKSDVGQVVVVVAPGDDAVAEAARRAGATVAVPVGPPPDMKASIRHGLEWAEENLSLRDEDAWLVAPADLPNLDPGAIDRLLDAYEKDSGAILVAAHRGRRGHPALFPWSARSAVAALPADAGLNRLLAGPRVREVECGPGCLAADIDTPEDYRRQRPN